MNITLSDVKLEFGTMAEKPLSYEFSTGAFTVLRGRSGTGKTTLLHTMAGFQAPASGNVYWDEQDYYSFSKSKRERLRQEQVGWVDQEYGMISSLTVQENIVLGCSSGQIKTLRPMVCELAEELAITHVLKSRPMNISGGERQRAAIIRALIYQSRSAFILDEPTSALDLHSTELVMDLLLRKCHNGATLVIASHDQEVIARAEHIIELDHTLTMSDIANP